MPFETFVQVIEGQGHILRSNDKMIKNCAWVITSIFMHSYAPTSKKLRVHIVRLSVDPFVRSSIWLAVTPFAWFKTSKLLKVGS